MGSSGWRVFYTRGIFKVILRLHRGRSHANLSRIFLYSIHSTDYLEIPVLPIAYGVARTKMCGAERK